MLHFNSHHSLVQWTAAIRLAMFEYTTLQESYTGALIAGKGKTLNNINQITSKTIFKYQDMVRVRFGAGTPWRQCWCVVYPPDEKEVQKLEKELKKKKSVYDRSRPPILKGSVKFFDSKKIGKKTQPIATITDAYSAYAIYPQSKPLIDASTLVKLEGTITIHSDPPTSTEGFVFVMPEVHAAVSGFEIMLRWLFPVYDTFALYGRPTRLVADPLDPRSLMFGMPTDRRYGYLELLDVAGLISTEGSQTWNEATWRKNMKDLTQRRMTSITVEGGSRRNSRRMNTRDSDRASVRSTPAVSWGAPPTDVPGDIPRTDSAPAARPNAEFEAPRFHQHHRSASDSLHGRASRGLDSAPPPLPPPHMDNSGIRTQYLPTKQQDTEMYGAGEPVPELQHLAISPAPVAKPPGFSHAPGTAPPAHKLTQSPELRRAKSRMSNGTLSQLAGAGGLQAQQRVAEYQRGIEQARIANEQNQGGRPQDRGVNHATTNATGSHANPGLREGMVEHRRLSYEFTSPDYRAPGETSTFANKNIPYHNHSENHSNPAYQNLKQAYQPSSFGGPPMNSAHNPVVAAVASSHDSRSSYESARASMDSNQNRRSIQRKPLHGSPSRNNDSRAPADPQRLEQVGRGISNMSGYVSNHDETPTQDVEPHQHAGNRPSFERPRTGMLKTVGGYEQGQQQPKKSSDIPRVDFGPTINYAQNGLPSSSDRQSRGPDAPANTQHQGPPQKKVPDAQYCPEHQRNQGSRQMAWQPGMLPASADAVANRAMTPEEFVQQRAQAASQPQYAHQRQKSSTNNMRASATPPYNQAKPDYFTHSRGNSSLDLLQQSPNCRPQSRGAGATLGGGAEDRLTAREQTHISRMTGAPLVNMATGPRPGGSQQAGLVGSIDQREMEKRMMKQGLNERQRMDAADANYRQGYGQQQMQPRVSHHGQQQQNQGYGQNYGQGRQQRQQQQPTQEEVQYQQRRLEMQREAFQNQQRPGGNGPGPGRGMGNGQGQGQYRG